MPLDANGIHQYEESETVAPFAEFMNRLSGSVSDEIGKLQRADPSIQITNGTDWLLSSVQCKTAGGLCSIDLFAEYTGTTNISATASGDIPDQLIGIIQEASLRPTGMRSPLITSSAGRFVSGYINTGGELFIASITAPSIDIIQGEVFRLGATYIL